MSSFADGIVTRDDARKIYIARSKKVDEKIVTAVKKDALAIKVQGEEKDGWSVVKKNTKSVRVSKPKPEDRQLEDDVWCLLYKLGFKEFNADRNFTVKLGPSAPGRQLDVFAKDDETVFIVECTSAQEQKTKSIKGLIDKINGIREDVIMAIHAHYGKEPKLKVKWAIATRNIDWQKADKDRAADAKIAVITEADIDYYNKLISYIKEAARYQFLGRYLKNEGVDGLRIEIPATKGKIGGVAFYNFLVSPFDLLKIAYISHKAISSDGDFDTYQRMAYTKRLQRIAAYIDEGGQFPTNIIINFKTSNPLNFRKIQSYEDTAFGTLTLPGQYGCAWVIDGQHRLYGYAFSKGKGKHVVPVLAYENLPIAEEMKLFVDINSEQVKVSRALLNEIYADLKHTSDDPIERFEAQFPRIALKLDRMASSPVRERVQTASKDKDHTRCLSLTSLADGIRENRFLGSITKTPPNLHVLQPGPLCHQSGDLDLTTEKATAVVAGYFNLFATGAPAHWQLGDAKGGFLCTNNGLRALLRLLRELIAYCEEHDHIKAADMDAEDIMERIAPYVEPVVEYFKNADQSEIQSFRSRQALDGVRQNCFGMMGIICEAKSEFTNKELTEYLSTRDKEGTNIARQLIDKINEILFDDVLRKLKAHFGTDDDNWWWKGIPQTTRQKCDEQVNRDNGQKKRYQYLSLADYQTIVTNNWLLFEKQYGFDGKGKKADKVSWIGHINKIRQTTHHPEKGIISKDDVAYIKQIHERVVENILNKH